MSTAKANHQNLSMLPVQFHLSLTSDPLQGEALLTIEGELVLTNAGLIWSKMREAFTGNNSVRVVVQSVTQADLSFIQLCYAARRSAEQSGVSCLFELELSEEFKLLLTKSGFSNLLRELTISAKRRP
jgi:ABC-type transporter Mla MlaB component